MLLSVKNLDVFTPLGRRLMTGINFSLSPGQLLLVEGPNGIGKTTLLKTLLGEYPNYRGTIESTVSADQIEYIPQIENTEIHWPLLLEDILTIARVPLESEVTHSLLDLMQLKVPWNTASGGERKKTLLIRALSKDPRLLIFDEPMNHLDEQSRNSIILAMAEFLNVKKPRGIILVSHVGFHSLEEKFFNIQRVSLSA